MGCFQTYSTCVPLICGVFRSDPSLLSPQIWRVSTCLFFTLVSTYWVISVLIVPLGFSSSPEACFLWSFVLMPLSFSHLRRFSFISSICLCSPSRMSFALHPPFLWRNSIFFFASFVCEPYQWFQWSPLRGFCFSPLSFLFCISSV